MIGSIVPATRFRGADVNVKDDSQQSAYLIVVAIAKRDGPGLNYPSEPLSPAVDAG